MFQNVFRTRPIKIRTSSSPRGPPAADSQDPPEGPFVTLCAAVIKYRIKKKLSGSLTVNKPKIKQESHTRYCFTSQQMRQLVGFEKEHCRASISHSSALKKALPTSHIGDSYLDYHHKIVATTLTCQESSGYIDDPNLLKIFGDILFFHSRLFLPHSVCLFILHIFFRAFTCHLDRRQRGKSPAGAVTLMAIPSQRTMGGDWGSAKERQVADTL